MKLHTASQRVRRAPVELVLPTDNTSMMISFCLLALGFIAIGLLGGWSPR